MAGNLLKPSAAKSNPPAEDKQGQGQDKAPQDRDAEVENQAKRKKQEPEHFFLHGG
jgi:hypothetical protein